MRHPLLILLLPLFLVYSSSLLGNMANPVWEGTFGSRPFVSDHVDILKEELEIKIDSVFNTASYEVKYYINSKKEGEQIPFLFYASDFQDSFTVQIDGTPLELLEMPAEYRLEERFKGDYSYFFDQEYRDDGEIVMWDSEHGGFHIHMKDMLYFKTDIPEGNHVVEVHYNGLKWVDTSDPVKEYSFRYALYPAEYWKSFGKLFLTIDGSAFNGSITTNLGPPNQGNVNEVAHWEFDGLPTRMIHINNSPEIAWFPKMLIGLTPLGCGIIIWLFIIVLHVKSIYAYRKRKQQWKFSPALIIGSVVSPFLFLLAWMCSYYFPDYFIGNHAGSHGYTFLVFMFYPFILPFYWLVFWLIDRHAVKKNLPQSEKV